AHPGPDISRAATVSLADLTVSQADRVLAELTDAHLLDEFSPGRFAFHDLLRAYATEQAMKGDGEARSAGGADGAALEAARARALDHYLQTGFAAALLLEPHRARITMNPPEPGVRTEPLADYHQALAWFQAEHRVMLAAVAMAASSGHDAHAWRLAWTLSDFLDWRGHWHDWMSAQEIALGSCRRLGDVVGQAHAHRSIARAFNQLGRYEETLSHLGKALDLYGQAGDALGQARCHIDMAAVLERLASYEAAIDHSEQALRRFRAIGHPAGEANALNAVGWCHGLAGHHALALDYCRQAVDLQRQIGDKHAEAASWDSVGVAHHHLGQHDEALACYRRSLGFYTEIGHRYSQAEILSHLAETQQACGEADAASQSWRQALAILEDLDHPDAERVRARLAGSQ
ncbi:MAG: tetratricopeptide repeat protein, partial [Streptosporangiaceae bacterium]